MCSVLRSEKKLSLRERERERKRDRKGGREREKKKELVKLIVKQRKHDKGHCFGKVHKNLIYSIDIYCKLLHSCLRHPLPLFSPLLAISPSVHCNSFMAH